EIEAATVEDAHSLAARDAGQRRLAGVEAPGADRYVDGVQPRGAHLDDRLTLPRNRLLEVARVGRSILLEHRRPHGGHFSAQPQSRIAASRPGQLRSGHVSRALITGAWV